MTETRPERDYNRDREVLYVGGPRDGQRTWDPKAILPGVFYPNPDGGPGGAGVGLHRPIHTDRGFYYPEGSRSVPGSHPLHILTTMTWYGPGEWTGPLWSCSWHELSGNTGFGCPDCDREKADEIAYEVAQEERADQDGSDEPGYGYEDEYGEQYD